MSEVLCLRDVFEFSEGDVEAALVHHTTETGGGRIEGFAASVAAEKLNAALDVDVTDALALGWSKVKAVRDAAQKSLKQPGETSVVTLGQHELASTHHPVLTLSVAGLPTADLRFTLELVAQFRSVKLAISDGRLRAVSPGEASALVRLKYKKVELGRKSTPAWKLPGEIRLRGQGIAVARPDRDASAAQP